jgi:multidrug efflux pump subunit AcrB
VRLGQIARIVDRFELDEEKILFDRVEPMEEKSSLEGRRAGILNVTKTKSEDTLTVFDKVSAFVEEARKTAPTGVDFALTRNVSSIVRDRLDMLTRNAFQGLALVFLVMWLFFNFRFSFWVAMGLPVSFMGAFFFLPLLGLTINMMTMVGLLLAIGVLMDDAIVISENIATHLSRGAPVMEAVVAGTGEVKVGVLYSFLTTVCIFGPLCFISGMIGQVLRVMPMILILVLSVSIVEAFFILPAHLAHSLVRARAKGPNRFRRSFTRAVEWVRDRLFGRIIDAAVNWRYLAAGITLMVFMGSLALVAGGVLKFQAFPEIDGDMVIAEVLMPQGTPLAKCDAVVRRLTDALYSVNEEFKPAQPGGRNLVTNVNVQYGSLVQFDLEGGASENGPHVATIVVDLLSAEERNARLDDVLNLWREKTGDVADVIDLRFAQPQMGPGGKAIDLTIWGEDLSEMDVAAREVIEWLGEYRGVHDLAHDLRPGKPEVIVRPREGAAALGLSARDIAGQLRSALYGKTAREIQEGYESYEVDVRLVPEDQDSLSDLEYFRVTLSDGSQTPLAAVATIEPGRSYARIARLDGRRAVRVTGDIDQRRGNADEILGKFREGFLPGFRERHPALSVAFRGEAREMETTQTSMYQAFVMGVIAIYLMLAFQFKSYIEPVIIMLAIPLALIGVVWGHMLLRLELSMPSTMGFVALSGIVVNDSLLLVQFVKMRRREGMAVPGAAKLASRQRFRAVMLTSLTTMAGLTPLLVARSLQAQVLIPLATSLVFGLLSSTVLVLIVIPVLYTILDDFGVAGKVEVKAEPSAAEA